MVGDHLDLVHRPELRGARILHLDDVVVRHDEAVADVYAGAETVQLAVSGLARWGDLVSAGASTARSGERLQPQIPRASARADAIGAMPKGKTG
jgi:hypothetical protein